MRVAKDTVVTIEYRASLEDGNVVDSTDHCGPVSYLQGNEQIFPALERALEGLEPGAETELVLAPAESYGERRESLVRRIARAQLPPALVPMPGERYQVRARDGSLLVFRVVAIEGEEIVADFNSRAAGQSLRVHAKVLGVRSATPEELRRGTLR